MFEHSDLIDLLGSFSKFIEQHELIAPGDKILAAVSGGKDSVALLDLLHRLVGQDRLGAVYIDHGWDPERHASEHAFVKDLTDKYSIPFHTEKANAKRESKPSNISLEAWSRRQRYRLLSKVLGDNDYNLCALGHTADDQAETVLMRLMNGSGLWGLSGIPVKRDKFIRPMLEFSTLEVLHYLALRNLRHLEDPTNRDLRFQRSRIRHILLPKLELNLNPVVKQALIDLSQDIVQWKSEVNRVFPPPIIREKGKIILAQGAFFSYLDILKKIWLQEALQEVTGVLYTLRRHHIRDVNGLSGENKTGKWIQLPGRVRLLRDRDRLILVPQASRGSHSAQVSVGNDECRSLGVRFRAEVFPVGDVEYSDNPRIEWMDFDALALPWVLRRWKAGDRFHPLGAPGHRKISDFLIDRKVPKFEKDQTLVLEAGGEIMWLVGHRISQRAKINEQTKRAVRCEVSEIDMEPLNGISQL